jgi:single-stranded DNA-binding protein
MIEGLVSGRIFGKPERRTGRKDSRYVAARIIVTTQDHKVTAHVIAFEATAQQALLALDDGDAVSVAGTLTPKLHEDKNGTIKPALDVIAHQVLSVYQLQHKRQAAHELADTTLESDRSPPFDD